MSQANHNILIADAKTHTAITEEQAQFFRENGFLIIRNLLENKELQVLQDEMQTLLDRGMSGVEGDNDYQYGKGTKSGGKVLKRIEYVVDKSVPTRALLAHPFVLNSVEKLQGNNFIPTWDSMVIKMPNEGIIVPWHRDAERPVGCADDRPIFNVDFYLDSADIKSCLWVIPGSNLWTIEASKERCSREGFETSDAIPVPLEAGDAILHDITVVHGSPSGDGNALRRTIYFEFRPGEIELEFGPHNREYLSLKQQVLLECIETRKAASYIGNEKPYEYKPSGELSISGTIKPNTFRYPHEEYWIGQ
ncbi:phytanoyl-CoA dioxygenase family protein [Cohnella herbarum]|uniref:Phytanoyl-CoA dioxygenase family protein n=1 Tax=Cohnella herbarum TaxID=2728023 RepID=A0A7Z2ZJM1_9BACL|nr:phytanoyl-CoA dioxygenase family protein [Cohnella herbarum]QJD82073.1 phytanoyl-CoA dioxygenase family protein [Cohnella herbarum]